MKIGASGANHWITVDLKQDSVVVESFQSAAAQGSGFAHGGRNNLRVGSDATDLTDISDQTSHVGMELYRDAALVGSALVRREDY